MQLRNRTLSALHTYPKAKERKTPTVPTDVNKVDLAQPSSLSLPTVRRGIHSVPDGLQDACEWSDPDACSY